MQQSQHNLQPNLLYYIMLFTILTNPSFNITRMYYNN